jgi:hypothetical protein
MADADGDWADTDCDRKAGTRNQGSVEAASGIGRYIPDGYMGGWHVHAQGTGNRSHGSWWKYEYDP